MCTVELAVDLTVEKLSSVAALDYSAAVAAADVRHVRGLEEEVLVCCSVLECVAVCCSLLQCVAVCCSVLRQLMCSTCAD